MTTALAAGDRPYPAVIPSSARAVPRQGLPLKIACVVVGILGITACATGTSRGEPGPGSPAPGQVRPGQVFRDCDVCPEMVVVPPGSYMMGSPEDEVGRGDREGPRHRVTIAYSLAVGVYEVTFAEWDACVAAGECDRPVGRFPGLEGSLGREIGLDPREPVVMVSWDDARRYADWLSAKSGVVYRLLSESEWEYVARAGTETAWYWRGGAFEGCWHENMHTEDRYFGYPDVRMENVCFDGFSDTAPVGSFEPNPWGLHDMLGNVSEWTEDCWHDSYDGAPSDGRAWTCPDESDESWFRFRVMRGFAGARSAFRSRQWTVGHALTYYGFRVARTINNEPEG